MIFKLQIVLQSKLDKSEEINSQKQKVILKDGIFYFYILKDDAYTVNKVVLKIISVVSTYEEKEILILPGQIGQEFFTRVMFQLELYNSVRKDDQRFIISFEGDDPMKVEKFNVIKSVFADYYHAVRLPANKMDCDTLSLRFREDIAKHKLVYNTKIIEIIASEDSELHAIYAVGKASQYRPRLFIVEFGEGRGTDKKEFSVGICGKGVCYDTGGLSLKPACGMVDMAADMGGSALGFYASLCYYLLFKKPLLYAAGIAENSIGSKAYRPGDVIKSYSGKKIMIKNTDAEGRVVLADVISYISKNYKIYHIVTLATLTGAARIVCGRDYCPYVAVNGDHVHAIIANAKHKTAEYLVALPNESMFLNGYLENAGDYADIANITNGCDGGSHGPAQFLNYFINDKHRTNYTHFDVANYYEEEVGPKRRSSSDLLEFMIEFISQINK